ncbi:MAG: citrate synthase [Fibrobacter sp.]|jgi:citrate synthase|nr:citrate synthase [Fibrobacter sp.]
MAKIELDNMILECPVIVGAEKEKAIDISELRAKTGYITLDDSFSNTGSCKSAITYIDGDKGILRYRGYPIEELAAKSSFAETAFLVIYGHLPNKEEYSRFSGLLTDYEILNESFKHHYEGFPNNAPPMAMLSAMINALSCYQPEVNNNDISKFDVSAARLISQVRVLAASAYKMSVGLPTVFPYPEMSYAENFLHMMFSLPNRPYEMDQDIIDALNMFLILHIDHEQNCSTSTVRLVASSGANLYASCAAGVCALWGRLHGGANQAVVEMLNHIKNADYNVKEFIDMVKNKKNGVKLMGFGHRVYKNFDPRSKILQAAAHKLFKKAGQSDELLSIAQELADYALNDEYFIERKLYPNVDFYSGLIMQALGIPLNMFTVLFAIGRMPGWIAHWKELSENPKRRIYRPRQIYVGETLRHYEPMSMRG